LVGRIKHQEGGTQEDLEARRWGGAWSLTKRRSKEMNHKMEKEKVHYVWTKV